MSDDILETLLSGGLADPDGGPPRSPVSAVSRANVEACFGAEPGAPTGPEDLHWPHPSYRDAVRHAREMRNRYAFLDLAADSGWLDDTDIL